MWRTEADHVIVVGSGWDGKPGASANGEIELRELLSANPPISPRYLLMHRRWMEERKTK